MIGDWEDVEFVIHHHAVFVLAEGEQEALVKSRLYLSVSVSAVPLMHIHDYGVQLFQTGHSAHQEDHQSSALDCLDGPAEQVGCECLKVLKDEHLVGVAEYLVGLLVVGVADLIGADKEFEGVVHVLIIETLHLHVLDLGHAFLLVGAELQVVLVAPEDLGLAATASQLAQHVVEVEYLVARPVAHQHQHRPLLRFIPVLDQGLDTRVDLLLHC